VKRRHQNRAAQALLGSGDRSAVAPPVPIPNTEVKHCSADGSTATGRVRVGRRQNRLPSMSLDVLGVLLSSIAHSSGEHDAPGGGRIDGQGRRAD
jgi:hypothetical protein